MTFAATGETRNPTMTPIGEVPLAGYTDRLSARPGETVRFCLSANPTSMMNLSSDAETGPDPSTVLLRARLTRSISADPNPKGPGIIEVDASRWFPERTVPAHHQPIPRGSYASTVASLALRDQPDADSIEAVNVELWFFPTLIPTSSHDDGEDVDDEDASTPRNVIWSWGDSLGLYLMPNGCLRLVWQSTSGNLPKRSISVSTTTPCKCRRWYHVSCSLKSNGSCSVTVTNGNKEQSLHAFATRDIDVGGGDETVSLLDVNGPFSLATGGTLNGRIEYPSIRYVTSGGTGIAGDTIFATWDTSYFPPSSDTNDGDGGGDLWTIPCTGRLVVDDGDDPSYSLHLYHYPTRALKGHLWDGTEFCWSKCPRHYGAIHFHDDDVYDFQWTPTMEWTLPLDIPSGIYIMRFTVQQEEGGSSHDSGIEEALPIFICAPKLESAPSPNSKTKQKKKLAVLIPTFTYVMYGNHARPDFESDLWMARTRASPGSYPHNPCHYPKYGWSTYNFHSDGSGIHFASHLRPLFNVRPGYITFSRDGGYHDDSNDGDEHPSTPVESFCSGLRHFPADSHLIAWLHHHDIEYEIITDHELHREGVTALDPYATVLTTSHPEYHTYQTLEALQRFRDDRGGNLVYLGGNGFYWKIAASPSQHSNSALPGDAATSLSLSASSSSSCSLLEIRRCESGVRTWAAEVGEYYNYLDGGGYGGLWRNSGRPPSKLVGIGFSAQGGFVSKPYHRTCWDRPDVTDWVFKGIAPDDTKVLGNYGLSGNGAAGYELDRIDPTDDSTADLDIVIIAQARTDSDERFMLVPEEVLTPWTNLAGTSNAEAKRADMVYFQCPDSGAQVFAVGSITFCGSLPYNQFDNVISKVLKNVVDRFMEEDE